MTKYFLSTQRDWNSHNYNVLDCQIANLLVILPLCSSLAPTTVYIENKVQLGIIPN